MVTRLKYCSTKDAEEIVEKSEVLEASHICGNRFCIHMDHIIYEPHARTNVFRDHCQDRKKCVNPGHHPIRDIKAKKMSCLA